MRAREILIALAAATGTGFAILRLLGAGGELPRTAAAAAAEPEPSRPPAALPATLLAASGIRPPGGDAAPGEPDAGSGEAAGRDPRRSRHREDAKDPPLSWRDPRVYFPPREDLPGLLARLRRERRQQPFRRLFHRIWGSVAFAGRPASTLPDRRDGDPSLFAPTLLATLEECADPVARQTLIFHLAMTAPPALSFPVLEDLRRSDDPEDAEDALCALAFRGDPGAMRDFRALSLQRSPAAVHRLVDSEEALDLLAGEGRRDVLRAYRCIEALDGSPYFRDRGGFPAGFPWAEPAPGTETAAADLLPAWLRRYPGHPGSDDMAWRLARLAEGRGDHAGAVRWAGRAATLPDQDMSRAAVDLLVTVAEWAPLDSVAAALEPDPEEPDRNRCLLLYIRVRRLAAEVGFGEAVAEVARIAATEPDLPLSLAFRSRWAEPAPRGLDSGLRPLPGTDPLRRVRGERVRDLPLANPACAWRSDHFPLGADGEPLEGPAREEARLRPHREAVRFPLRRMAFQFRCWSTLAELERRGAAAVTTAERDDLLYRTGAVLHHERDALHPAYAPWHVNRNSLPDAGHLPPGSPLVPDGDPEVVVAWLRRNDSRLRAAALFRRLAEEQPGSPVADRAAFSLGLSLVRAAEDAPLRGWITNLGRDVLPWRLREEGAAAFERCARDHPSSPLADDAARAAAYWRARLRRERGD